MRKAMNRNNLYALLLSVILTMLASCSSTKYVADGEYLLNKTAIKVETKQVSADQLNSYITQKPNKNALFIPKMGLHIYSLSGRDTSKWINRVLRKMGSAPVICDQRQITSTERQLTKRMQNLGYLNAEVSHCVDTTGKKVNVTYCVRPHDLYTINQFKTEIEPVELRSILKTKKLAKYLKIKENHPFESDLFNDISSNINNTLHDLGYYYLTKDHFYYMADTAVGNHKVDVVMKYRSLTKNDTLGYDQALQRMKIRNVTILNGIEQQRDVNAPMAKGRRHREPQDTTQFEGITIINRKEEKFIRSSVLYSNNFVRPGRYYTNRSIENTYSSFNGLGAVSQVGIQFSPVAEDSSLLDAKITLTPSNIYHFQFGVDGTNTAGDLGVASYVAFQQKNLFKGSEILALKVNGAFEHIKGNTKYDAQAGKTYTVKTDNYYEYGGELSLTIPRIILDFLPQKYRHQVGAATTFSFSANWRKRPEYRRQFLSLDWLFNWYSHRKRWHHTFDLYNINFVKTSDISDWFEYYLDKKGNEMLKESYKDQFITRTSYTFSYVSNTKEADKNGWTLRGGLDVAGTLPFTISSIFSEKNEDGHYEILKTPFAQYAKMSFDVTRVFPLRSNCQMVLHGGFGVGVPYGNSDVIPYEQRFFAGGANTVRGWSTRTLGPGSFESKEKGNFLNQTGDVKIIMNLEYRFQTNTFIDLATFVDAGNVWTIKNYANQQNGAFSWSRFYKEMGLSWGLGIRPNFKFIIIRLDAGMKVYDPALTFSKRWVITHPTWKESFALHFAIGYPF